MLNFFERGLFEDVKAEGYRWVKKEDIVSELIFLFINLNADSTLFFLFFCQFLDQNQESFLKKIFEMHSFAYFHMTSSKSPPPNL